MKKNFLKKLSFVLASAMVVSVVSPAASAFAATSVKLNATKKYLHLDVDGKNEYDFNIKGKQSGWKYLWESSNEDIAVVNEKNGVVTATGVGTAKVSVVITDKKGKEVDELKATVVVRDNIKEVSIANKPDGDKLAIGEKFDFNRNFVTNSGNTKKTSAVTRWTVEPATGATIDNSGVFVATKPGEYTVTARSFQSTAKFNEWKANPAGKASLVLDDASYKLTVAASIKEVAQVDKDTIKVTFDSPVTNVKDNVQISQLVNNTKIKQLVNKVEMNSDNTVATIDLFLALKAEATYVVDFTGMESKSVVAAKSKLEDVAAIKITTSQVPINKNESIGIALLNKDGVDITSPELLTRVTVKGNNEPATVLNADDKKIIIYKKGTTATVTATFHTWKYNSLGQEEGTLQAVATIVGVEDVTTINGLKAYTIVDTGSKPNFSDVKQLIAAQEFGKRLFVELNTLTGNTKDTTDSFKNPGHFTFTSSDETILVVDPYTGALYPNQAGSVVVVVNYGTDADPTKKEAVGTIVLTIAPKRASSTISLDTNGFTLSNANKVNDGRNVTLTVLDQMQRPLKDAEYKVEKLAGPDNIYVPSNTDKTNGDGKATITFNAQDKKEGDYSYKVIVGSIVNVVTISVRKPDAATPSYYRLQVKETIDTKITSNAQSHAAAIELIGYAPNGVKVDKVNLKDLDDNFIVEVEVPSNAKAPFEKDTNNDGSFALTYVHEVKDENGNVINAITKKTVQGTYQVSAYEKNADGVKVPLAHANFTVTDSQDAAKLSKYKTQGFSKTVGSLSEVDVTLIEAVHETLEFSIGSKVLEKSNIKKVKASGTTDSIFVYSVVIEETIGNAKIEHTVDVNTLIKKK